MAGMAATFYRRDKGDGAATQEVRAVGTADADAPYHPGAWKRSPPR